MAATARTRNAPRKGARRAAVTDRDRANALLWLAGGSGEVADSDIELVLRTMGPNHVVRVGETRSGPVYRATPAGQRWAVAQLASSPLHMGNLVRKSSAAVIEERPGGEWRVIDHMRRVRTPWLASGARTPIIEKAARAAVRRTDPARLVAHRHTRDEDWVVVHSL